MSKKETGGQAFPLDYVRYVQIGDEQYREPIERHEQYKGMTLRDYSCIKLKVPDTDKDWLNEIIVKSLKNDFAGQALIALIQKEPEQTNTLSNPGGRKYEEWMAGEAYLLADAMIKERTK